jgi:hypothetical protein
LALQFEADVYGGGDNWDCGETTYSLFFSRVASFLSSRLPKTEASWRPTIRGTTPCWVQIGGRLRAKAEKVGSRPADMTTAAVVVQPDRIVTGQGPSRPILWGWMRIYR